MQNDNFFKFIAAPSDERDRNVGAFLEETGFCAECDGQGYYEEKDIIRTCRICGGTGSTKYRPCS